MHIYAKMDILIEMLLYW